MRIVVVEPGKPARKMTIKKHFKEMQKIVGGPIEAVSSFIGPTRMTFLGKGQILVCNEEGKLDWSLQPNRTIGCDVIYGTFFFCGYRKDDFCSLTRAQTRFLLECYQEPEVF